MARITKVKTENYEEWKALRSRYIGGSDAAAVVGLNAYSSPYSLWAEKTGRVPGFEGNLATEVGTYLEEFVAQKFADETGKKVRRANASFFNSDYPWAIANIDREIVGEDAGLEIKTTDSLNLSKFRGGEYPTNYYAQMVHYMAITGKQRWYLAVLIGNKDFRWFVLDRNEAEIDALMNAEKEFWRLVEEDVPPEIDGTQATTAAVKAIYTDSEESTVDLTGYNATVRQYIALSKQIKELEKQLAEAANRIKAFMGESEFGESADFQVSWKPQIRRTFDSKKFAAEHWDMDLSGYYKETKSRTFKVSEL